MTNSEAQQMKMIIQNKKHLWRHKLVDECTDLLHGAWSTEWRVHKLFDSSKWTRHHWYGCINDQNEHWKFHMLCRCLMLLPLVVESVLPAPVKHLPLFHISSLISFMICNKCNIMTTLQTKAILVTDNHCHNMPLQDKCWNATLALTLYIF